MSAYPLTDHVLDLERRKAERAEVALDTVMCDRAGNMFGACILNMSHGGMMATTETPMFERDPVRINLPTIGWVRATIVWVLGNRVGLKLRMPLSSDDFALFQRMFA